MQTGQLNPLCHTFRVGTGNHINSCCVTWLETFRNWEHLLTVMDSEHQNVVIDASADFYWRFITSVENKIFLTQEVGRLSKLHQVSDVMYHFWNKKADQSSITYLKFDKRCIQSYFDIRVTQCSIEPSPVISMSVLRSAGRECYITRDQKPGHMQMYTQQSSGLKSVDISQHKFRYESPKMWE